MGDSSDDMEAWSDYCFEDDDHYNDPDRIIRMKYEILTYCYPHLHLMWAARIASILLECDFRDAKHHSDIYFSQLL